MKADRYLELRAAESFLGEGGGGLVGVGSVESVGVPIHTSTGPD